MTKITAMTEHVNRDKQPLCHNKRGSNDADLEVITGMANVPGERKFVAFSASENNKPQTQIIPICAFILKIL